VGPGVDELMLQAGVGEEHAGDVGADVDEFAQDIAVVLGVRAGLVDGGRPVG